MENTEITNADIIEALWGLALSDHLGDAFESVMTITRKLGIGDNWSDGSELISRMKELDFIPDYHRQDME